METRSLLFSPKKPFHLLVYAAQMASAFADFGCSKPKRRKNTYALNVLDFIDGSAFEGRETSESSSSTTEDSVMKSTTT